ncbi:DUF2169 domain-containing protein [Sorangium sp. So ce1078]|uniref:DUF2169 family type VI secretion system accessory protein n=1 Tax=Sorangium sp. So ce1078 TaxID=3133329 RepID=UPI003F60BE25
MRVIKPLRLSILQRVITVRRESRLTIGLLVYFPFEAPDLPLPEVAMWQKVVKQLGKDAALDEGLPKPRGELLVHGKAFSPGGQPRQVFQARVQVGAVDKAIFVVGRRKWAFNGPTEPEPITEMPVTYANAFGGPGYPQNPVGMGFSPVEENGVKVHYLPHLEDPRNLVQSPVDRPAPAGFTPIDITWPQRAQQAGTYGARWLETEFPGLASDLDPDFFQAAPLDQRIDGYFQGGETVVIENMHPTRPRLDTRVPRLRARCFVAMKGAGGELPLHEIPTRLDTVILFPNIERGVAVFRAVQPIAEDDAADVGTLLAALEGPESPRSLEHYRATLAQRVDREKGHLYGLREKDLLPEPDPGAPALSDEIVSDMDELIRREGVLQQRAHARAKRELEQARLSMRVLGIDPDEKLPKEIPPPEKPPSLDELPEYVERVQAQAKQIQAEAEARQRSALEEARATCAAQGIDFDALVERGRKEGGGPPAFRAETEIARLRELAGIARAGGAPMPELEAKIEDPAFRDGLAKMEDMQLFAYRSYGHIFPPAKDRAPEDQARLRAEVEQAIAEGRPLAGRDLTGADLRGLRLSGVNLRSALLERAELTGCDLSGADLSGALLARAKLDGARFTGATLAGTNLGEVEGEGTSFAGARLQKAVLYKARLSSASFSGADLRGADLMEASLRGADFGDAKAEEVLFFRADLQDARFSRAKLGKATFFQCSCEGIDFSEAILESTGFLELVARRASFREARARNLRLVSTTALPSADFTGADLRMATLRGVDFTGANFEDARVEGADFGESNLRGARLLRLSGRGSRFMRADLTDADLSGANLMEALLQHAVLAGAKFEDANLFRATLMGAKGDQRTRFTGAYVTQALFTRRSE